MSIMYGRVLKLVLLLVSGAIITVAVAWACALLIDPFGAAWSTATGRASMEVAVVVTKEGGSGLWGAYRYGAPGMLRFSSARNRAEPPWGPGADGAAGQDDHDDPASLVPAWSGFRVPTERFRSGGAATENRIGDARGWPMIAMWSMPSDYATAYIDETDVPRQVLDESGRGGLALDFLPMWRDPTIFSSMPDEARTLPLWIIPGGFAFNTVFYAFALWTLVAAPHAARRAIRTRRGLCASCGYPRGASGICSECGESILSSQLI